MKKWFVMLIASLLMAGCSKNVKVRSVDEVMEQMTQRVFFDSSSVLLEQSEVETFYFFGEGVLNEGKMRIASDTTANQVAVFKVNDQQSARKTIDEALARQRKEMEAYFPYEAEKVANACVMNELDLIVVVIADDSDCVCAEGFHD